MGKSRELLFTMATGTPRTVSHGGTLPVTLFLLLCIGCVWCQQFVFPFKAPSDCSAEEFFDISSLSCVRCGADQRQSTTGRCVQVTTARVGISGYSTDSTLIVSVFKMGRFNRSEAPPWRLVYLDDGFGWVQPGSGSMLVLFSATEILALRPLHIAIYWE